MSLKLSPHFLGHLKKLTCFFDIVIVFGTIAIVEKKYLASFILLFQIPLVIKAAFIHIKNIHKNKNKMHIKYREVTKR